MPISLRFCLLLTAFPAWIAISCGGTGDSSVTEHSDPLPETLQVIVLDSLKHDTAAFTQGFEIQDGILWESTGLYGSSTLRKLDASTGVLLQDWPLPDTLFGEGITIVEDQIFQLTWQSGLVLSWNLEDPEPVITDTIETQGWGICAIDTNTVVTSDGSFQLKFRNVSDFDIIRSIPVTLDNIPQIYLNELEYADGWIYANQWNSDRILRIDPSSGFVEALIDASNLLSPGDRMNAGPLNGIAWDSQRQAFLLTGKHWPWIFVVRFEEPI